MAEYIEREAIARDLTDMIADMIPTQDGMHPVSAESVLQWLTYFPAADVVPVRHGKWIKDENGHYHCPYCVGTSWASPDVPDAFNYCPNCGAKIDKKEDSDNA